MTRGTTPTQVLSFSGVDFTELQTVYVTYAQKSKITDNTYQVVLTKSNSDEELPVVIDTENNVLNVYLSQADTLLFNENVKTAQIQVRAILKNGTAIASSIVDVAVRPILLEGVIS